MNAENKTQSTNSSLHFCLISLLFILSFSFTLVSVGWTQKPEVEDYSGSKRSLGDLPKSNIVKIYNGWLASKSEKAMMFWPDHLTTFGKWSGTQGGYSSFYGYYAGQHTTGYYNSFFGQYSGRYTTTGNSNSFFGYYSGNKNTLGSYNSFFGYQSGYRNTNGNNNSFFGHNSGNKNTTGSWNSFFGRSSGYNTTTGQYNSFFGNNSGYSNTNSIQNSFFGNSSGRSNTTGNRNVFLGNSAGYSNTTSSNNTYLGHAAGFSSTGSYNVFLGSHAGSNETGSNKLYIENSNTSAPLIWGDFSTNHLKINGRLETTGNLQLNANGFIDDDATFGGHSDDWLRLKGYIEMKSNTDNYGIVLRDKDGAGFLSLTAVDNQVYLADETTYTGYFLKGDGANATVRGSLTTGGLLNVSYGSSSVQLGDLYGGGIASGAFRGMRAVWDTDYAFFGLRDYGADRKDVIINNEQSGDNIRLQIAGLDKAFIGGNGNMGIGTTDPKKKLHVNGGIARIESTHGSIDIGSTHSSWGHITTDRPKFYFNRGISVDQGIVSSYDEDLQLRTAGTTRMTLSNTDGNVTVNNNLILGGTLKFLDTQDIRNDNSVDDLLMLQGDGSLGTRSVQSIESPWMWEEFFNGQDTLLMVCPDSAIIGNVFIDVIDLNGNLRIGENAYIDDDINYGDDGTPDDWMKFNDRIEFRSSDPKHGIVLYDGHTFLNYTNITHDGGTTYFSNSKASDQYFMKATGEDVVFGGNVSFGGLSGGGNFTLNSPTSLYFAIDNDNNSGGAENNSIVFGRNSESGTGANFDELLVINEDGNVGIGNGTDQVTVPAGYRFSVDGKIVVEEIKVELSTAWPDYVFSPTYELMPIQALKSYIRERKHLPNVPSAQEIKDNGGMELGDMNKKLMEKVEELTLYLIDEHDRINAIQKELEALKAENQELRNALAQGR